MKPTPAEERFRALVRGLIAQGKHPSHAAVRHALGEVADRTGLSQQRTLWRADEVERAGYDWEASKRARRLVKKQRR